MASGETRLKIREVVVVEGKYDKNALSQVVDATILTTGGFALFKDKAMRKLLIRLAAERGIIILTDSDGAGLVIRNHISGLLPPGTVRHAYIPPRHGKEPRKAKPGAEGILGVEGVGAEALREALVGAGVTERGDEPLKTITKQDLYDWGLSGKPNSAVLRKKIQEKLDLPRNLSSKALCDVLTLLRLYDRIPELLREVSGKESENNA